MYKLLWSFSFLCVLSQSWLSPSSALAVRAEHYEIEAKVESNPASVRGHLKARVHVGAGENYVRLWVYADRVAVAPSAMNERNARWIYPSEISLGGTDVEAVRVDQKQVLFFWKRNPVGTDYGRDKSGAELWIPLHAGEARTVQLSLAFELRLPKRFGRLGQVEDNLSLLGPWYPLVINEEDSTDYAVPHHVSIEAQPTQTLLVHQRLFAQRAAMNVVAPYVPVFVSRELFDEEHQGFVSMHVIAADEPYHAPGKTKKGVWGLRDLLRIETVRHIQETAQELAATLRYVQPTFSPSPLTVLIAPLRTELASVAPGLVIVSDRVFQLIPVSDIREFHKRALRAAMLQALLAESTQTIERSKDRSWSTELRAAWWMRLDALRRHQSAKSPRDLVGFAAFHPAVDQFLYAPQIAFVDAFFGMGDAPDLYREDPAISRTTRARGAKILSNLQTLLSPAHFREFGQRLLASDKTVREVIQSVAPELTKTFEKWLAERRGTVNYRLKEVYATAVHPKGFLHTVVVERQGGERADPIEVRVTDDGGHEAWGVWPGQGSEGKVQLRTTGPLADAELDPRGLVYQSPEATAGHPRADDNTSHPYRPPLLQAFALNASLTEQVVSGFVEFAVRKRYNLEDALVTRIEHTPSTSGGALRYVHAVGPKVHTNRRVGAVSLGMDTARLHTDFAGSDEGGWGFGVSAGAGFDTRMFMEDPRRGESLGVGLRLGRVLRDSGDWTTSWSGGFRGSLTFPFGLRNALVLVGGGGVTLGRALASEKQSLGGRFLLRGYEIDELVGRGRLFGVVEHRTTLWNNLNWNFLHLTWIREIQFAMFTGAGALFDATTGEKAIGAAEVGAGLRLHSEYFGVQPAIFALDLGVPFMRREEDVERVPFGLYASFDQYF